MSNEPFAAQTDSGDDLNYAALHLSGRGATAGRKKKEEETEESVYSQVKRWMWICVHKKKNDWPE